MNEKAEDLAFGRWPDILQARGMPSAYFAGRNGPCPFCPDGGGKDRYRWVGKKYGGVWVCSICTEGRYASGFAMLMRHMGYLSFYQAADDVRQYFKGGSAITAIPRDLRVAASAQASSDQDTAIRNRMRMERIWNEGQDVQAGDPVALYLNRRVSGLDFDLCNVRFHPALPYWVPPDVPGGRFELLGRFPAMLAYAQTPDGSLAQLHKTYLTVQGQKADVPVVKKTDLGVGSNSFAVRISPVMGNTLGVSEGIETAAASSMLRRIPVWPCLNGPAMAEFELPPELKRTVRKVIIFEDADELKAYGRNADGSTRLRRPGSVYAQKLASRLASAGIGTMIIKSAKVGDDMADYWAARVAA